MSLVFIVMSIAMYATAKGLLVARDIRAAAILTPSLRGSTPKEVRETCSSVGMILRHLMKTGRSPENAGSNRVPDPFYVSRHVKSIMCRDPPRKDRFDIGMRIVIPSGFLGNGDNRSRDNPYQLRRVLLRRGLRFPAGP